MWYPVKDHLAIDQLYYNFLPSWWNKNYGVAFGERFFFDPDYRVQTNRDFVRTLHQRFPMLSIGEPDPQPVVVQPDLANASTPALAGCEVVYPDDNFPWSKHLAPEALSRLEAPDNLMDCFPYREMATQLSYLNNKYNQDVRPYIHPGGIVNGAMLVQGDSLFTQFAVDPEEAGRMLDFSLAVSRAAIRHDYEDFGWRDFTWLANCTAIMLGPDYYRQWQAPRDRVLYDQIRSYGYGCGIHHCGLFDSFIPEYRAIPEMHWVEIGHGSDIRAVLKAFPEAIVQYMFSPSLVRSGTREQVRETMDQILDATLGQRHRFRMNVCSIEYDAPDENVVEIYECLKRAS